MELQEKEEKDEKENCIERTQGKKCLLTLRIKAIYITGQRKAFCGQRIPESGCTRKETVEIEILIITRRKGDRKIMQTIGTTSVTATRVRKWNQFSQFRLTSTKVIAIEKT